MKYVGAHVSIAGGVENAPLNAAAIGARGFAMFTKNQRQWQSPPLKEESIAAFRENCRLHHFSPQSILPHDGYLINLGQPDDGKLEQSRRAFVDEMQRCRQLGLLYLNFHPGSYLHEIPLEDCLKRIAESVRIAVAEVDGVKAVIENTAGQGTNVGFAFEQLARLIELIDRPGRVGVCLDTCHAFAAGYDLSTEDGYEKVMAEFDRLIGFELLCGMHLNDDKCKLGSHLDRHDSLRHGVLGKRAFELIMQDPRIDEIPLVLETINPDLWPEEIKFLIAAENLKK